VKNNASGKLCFSRIIRSIVWTPLAAMIVMAGAGAAVAQDTGKKDVISFKLVPVQGFVNCLRANPDADPTARATVIRGKENDTLILDLDGVRPNLTLSVFSNERSFFGPDGNKDPKFHGFGLSWYQSDVSTGKRSDDGHVRLQTVFLDETFGFDPDVQLAPTNTFHIGLWFDDPQDAVGCGFDPTKAGPFNGEHKAGPLAFGTVPDAETGLGPLCTEPNTSTTPATCGGPVLLPALKP
jgi:hypothetical protein